MAIGDLVNDTVTTTLTAASNGLDEPVGFRISPDGNFGYVANLGTNEVLKIDLATNATIASWPVAGAFYIGITADGAKLYVFGYAPGTNVIDPATNAVAVSPWTAPADPWDFQTCPFATPPSPPTTDGSTSTSTEPSTSTSTTTPTDLVTPAFAG